VKGNFAAIAQEHWKKPAFQKDDFSTTFSPMFKDPVSYSEMSELNTD
jgi:hypothetical protein